MAGEAAVVPPVAAVAPPAVPGAGAEAPAAPAGAGGRPVQIVSISPEGDRFSMNEEGLAEVLDQIPRGMKVSVVSVVGAFRTGKSFLLDLMLGYLRATDGKQLTGEVPPAEGVPAWVAMSNENVAEGHAAPKATSHAGAGGFSWRPGRERCTTGIWLWSKPFMRKLPAASGAGGATETVAVLLMDTQGMFDSQTGSMLTASIFALSTLFSSTLVFNVKGQVQEDNLQLLSLFSEYGRMAYFGDAGPGGEGHQPFQHIQFLVRDSSDAGVEWGETPLDVEGLMADNARLVEDILGDRQLEDLADTRKQINTCFEAVTAFQLPHPGFAIAEGSFKGATGDIRPAFMTALDRYLHEVFTAGLAPKKVNGLPVTALQLKKLMVQYAAIFTDGTTPEPVSMLSATAAGNNAAAREEAQWDYSDAMGEVTGEGGYVEDEELAAHHAAAREAALTRFDTMANFGPASDRAAVRDKLARSIDDSWAVAQELNRARNPWRDFEVYFLAGLIGVIAWLGSALLDLTCSPWSTVCARSSDFLDFLVMLLVAMAVLLMVVTKQPLAMQALGTVRPLVGAALTAGRAVVAANAAGITHPAAGAPAPAARQPRPSAPGLRRRRKEE